MWISAESEDRLAQLGLRTYESFLHHLGGDPVSEVRDRVVYRIPCPQGGPAWFLKIYRKPGANHPLHQLLRGHRPVSLAEMEAANLRKLAAMGFLAPPLAAWGGRLSPFGVEQNSFILTVELEGMVPLDERLRALDETGGDKFVRKRALLEGCGRLLRELHDRGVHHPFPYLRHFFVSTGDPGTTVTGPIAVIDVDFAEIGAGPVSPSRRARGLAETLLSSYRSNLSPMDRLRFYRAYCGGPLDRSLAIKVLARFHQKLRRHPNRYRWVADRLNEIPFPPRRK